MPDLDQLLGQRLTRPVPAVPPPLGELQRRATRRRQRRWTAVAAAAAASVAVAFAAAGAGLLWQPDQPERPSFAGGLRDGVLDAGFDRDGRWRVVVTRDDGWCIKRVSQTGEGGACRLATPGRLEEASQFPTFDGNEYVVVLAGPAPPGTNRIDVTASGETVVATITDIEGRLFWTARVPPGDSETRAVAYDGSGAVIDELTWPPPPPSDAVPSMPDAASVLRCGPSLQQKPCAAGLEQGQQHPYLLNTHCGVTGVYADGREWVPAVGQNTGRNGAPAGFEDPEDLGSMTLVSEQRLQYRSSTGVTLQFVPGDIPAGECN